MDSELATADPGIRGAGDAICYPCPFLGGNRIRTEHEEHANESGVIAGAGVAGEPRSYAPIPSFHSSVGDLVWEGLGRLDLRGARTTVEAGSEPDAPGVALHRRDDRIQGVVVWNRPGRVPRIQRLLRDSAGGGDSAPGDEELERRILELVLE
ncbi:MAG: hypothetical protein EA352_12285 [Gemmatimonadales bacterium]|nr:MAG: hypothetical protein EA352_12285 [Gemmatimonadales bacterium]